MSNINVPPPSDPRIRFIDEVLQGQSAEVKARVLSVLVRYQIDIDNEFMVLFVAIGNLLAITEESPKQLSAVYESFAKELESWSHNFLRTIQEINHQAKTTEHLTQTLRESNSTFQALLKALMKLIETSQSTDRSLDSFLNKFESFKSVQASRLDNLEAATNRLNQLALWSKSTLERRVSIWSVSALSLTLGLTLGLVGGFALWRSPPPTPTAMMQIHQLFGHRA